MALGVLACAIGGAATTAGAEPQKGPGAQPRPNILVIMTDDQRYDEVTNSTMPTVVHRIADQGTTFKNNFVTSPLCCPSRSTFITGQYGHNHGVLTNSPGYPDLVDKPNVLPAWLHRAGYETGLVGKFMQGYVDRRARKPAPGWDKWYGMLRPFRYFDFRLGVNGKVVRFPDRRRFYLTSVLSRYAVRFVRKAAPRKKPFFLEYAPWAPHESHKEVGEQKTGGGGRVAFARGSHDTRCSNTTVPAPQDENAFLDAPLPMPPSFDEPDVGDKPDFIRLLPRFGEPGGHDLRDIVRRYRCRLASLPSVDRSVARLLRTLSNAGELDNTLIIFTSDNGFFAGEHRLALGKDYPYEESIRVPLIIRTPPSFDPSPPGSVVNEDVANIDLAPTILNFAAGAPGSSSAQPCISPTHCRVMDGRSMLPLLQGNTSVWPPDRALEIELSIGCPYAAVRTPRYMYAEYTEVLDSSGACLPSNEKELYDLQHDPYELQNLMPPGGPAPSPATVIGLQQQLEDLRACSGIPGRDPEPPRGRYCD